jgi:Fe2+ transport system protein FeoA
MTIFGQQLTLSRNRFFLQVGKAAGKPVPAPYPPNLAGAPRGSQVQVIGFSQKISPERRNQLAAYGLTPGAKVLVIQQSPVTVIQIDHIELALEGDLAQFVQIQSESSTLPA